MLSKTSDNMTTSALQCRIYRTNFLIHHQLLVIGASNANFNLGATICKTLKEVVPYKGRVYAVNRSGENVLWRNWFSEI